ncbi:MAG TPA: hypothetical protein VGH01_09205 [Jatrophihabitantaceae bacterium]|jgi:hypothetical protein
MTYPTGGDRGPFRDTPDYPTQQFRPVPAEPPPGPAPYEQDRYRQQDSRQQAPYGDEYTRDRRAGAPAGKRRLPWGWLILAAIVLIAAAGAGGYVAGHTQGKKDGRSSGPKHFLSHTAVEAYIAQQFGAANVQCYGGQDMPLTPNTAFTCTAAGASYVVVVKNVDTGSYQVVKTS